MIQERPNAKYRKGEIYDFKINAIHSDFLELSDEDGFHVYLQNIQGKNFSKGQTIQCRVLANYQKRPKIELVAEDDEINGRSKINFCVVIAVLTNINSVGHLLIIPPFYI